MDALINGKGIISEAHDEGRKEGRIREWEESGSGWGGRRMKLWARKMKGRREVKIKRAGVGGKQEIGFLLHAIHKN